MTNDTPLPSSPNPDQQASSQDAGNLQDPVFTMHLAAMREMAEPRDGISPTPVSYLVLIFFFLLWGGFYIGYYGGDWNGTGMSERPSSGAKTGPALDPMVVGKEVFGSCMQCHQEHGMGLPGQYPPLGGSEFVLGDKRRLAAIVLNGLSGPVIVKGANFNAIMPPWATRDDEEIAGVLTYIRNSFGNKAEPVSKEYVAAIRKEVENKGEWKFEALQAYAASTPTVPLPVAAPAGAPGTPGAPGAPGAPAASGTPGPAAAPAKEAPKK